MIWASRLIVVIFPLLGGPQMKFAPLSDARQPFSDARQPFSDARQPFSDARQPRPTCLTRLSTRGFDENVKDLIALALWRWGICDAACLCDLRLTDGI